MAFLDGLDHKRVGRTLIIAGVCVWIPYFVLKFAGLHPQVLHFLPFHLCGVIPGAVIARWPQISRLLGRSTPAAE
ncbi:MAG: hypothetical protein Kow0077_11090 [Anaerolineae bacterium]